MYFLVPVVPVVIVILSSFSYADELCFESPEWVLNQYYEDRKMYKYGNLSAYYHEEYHETRKQGMVEKAKENIEQSKDYLIKMYSVESIEEFEELNSEDITQIHIDEWFESRRDSEKS